MSRNSKYTIQQKITAVVKYRNGLVPMTEVAKSMGVGYSTFSSWCTAYNNGTLKLSNAVAIRRKPTKVPTLKLYTKPDTIMVGGIEYEVCND